MAPAKKITMKARVARGSGKGWPEFYARVRPSTFVWKNKFERGFAGLNEVQRQCQQAGNIIKRFLRKAVIAKKEAREFNAFVIDLTEE